MAQGTKSKRTTKRAAATSRDIKRQAPAPRTKVGRGTTKREKPATTPKRETAKAVLDEKYGRAHVDPDGLKIGQKLTAKYGGGNHTAEVVEGGFRVKGKTYKSLSAAGNAITGNSVNGRRFWSAG